MSLGIGNEKHGPVRFPHADGGGIGRPVRDGFFVGIVVVAVAGLNGARNCRRLGKQHAPVCREQGKVARRPDEGDRPGSPPRRVGVWVRQVDHQSTHRIKILEGGQQDETSRGKGSIRQKNATKRGVLRF